MPGINASSTADIAFMLLIFFLITTSMDTDRGLARRLPPPPENKDQKDDIIVKERNVLQVRLNKDDQLMVGGEWSDIKQLREKAKEFIANPNDAYLQVQNELVAAYNELRSELAKSKFGKEYAECSEEEKDAIMDYYPQKISEAEPKKYGGN